MTTSLTPLSWPPPPDLDSIQELVANADIEGFIAEGAADDEYETEAETIFQDLQSWPTADLRPDRILPVLEEAWAKAFSLGMPQLEKRRTKLQNLAEQIARFFGPEAVPQTRQTQAPQT